jgi:SAM-dependent methyltransferase
MADASLTAIANKYGSDKGTESPFGGPGHNYTDIYEAYLWPLRHRPIRLLEIGLGVTGDAWTAHIAQGKNEGGGASLKMWQEYFPQASIFGIDINPAAHLENERVRTFTLDQGDPDALRAFLGAAGDEPFDLIVDDGSHRADHQQISFGVLFRSLRPGGFYVVEDLMANGFDDPGAHGRFTSTRKVLNTRTVLAEMQRSGAFAVPNAIPDADQVASDIEWIHFHVPARRTESNLTLNPRRPVRLTSRFLERSDAMCVIRRSG